MSSVVLMAWSSPASPGVEGEFNSWYDDIHIPQVSKLLGVTAKVERFRLIGMGAGVRYAATYRLPADIDVASAGALLGAAMEAGALVMTAAMDVAVNPPELMWLETQL